MNFLNTSREGEIEVETAALCSLLTLAPKLPLICLFSSDLLYALLNLRGIPSPWLISKHLLLFSSPLLSSCLHKKTSSDFLCDFFTQVRSLLSSWICLVGSFSKANVSLKGKMRSPRPRPKNDLTLLSIWSGLWPGFSCSWGSVTHQCRWFICSVLNLSFHLIPVKTALISKSLSLNSLTWQHPNLNSSFFPTFQKKPCQATSYRHFFSWFPARLSFTGNVVFLQLLSHFWLFVTPELQHTRPLWSLLSPGVCLNLCPLNQWCHPTISSSAVPFSFCLQSFPASGSFPVSQLFSSGGQSIGATTSVLPMSIQGWFPLELSGYTWL